MDHPEAKQRHDLTTVEDFYRIAKDVQHRTGQKLAVDKIEDRCFCEYFGTGVAVAFVALTMLVENKLLEENFEISHLLR